MENILRFKIFIRNFILVLYVKLKLLFVKDYIILEFFGLSFFMFRFLLVCVGF